MSIIEAKYSVANNSLHATEPKKTIASTGFDLFTAKEKILIPRCVTPITIELKMEIRFGKICF